MMMFVLSYDYNYFDDVKYYCCHQHPIYFSPREEYFSHPCVTKHKASKRIVQTWNSMLCREKKIVVKLHELGTPIFCSKVSYQ